MTTHQTFHSIADVEHFLAGFYERARQLLGKDLTVARMLPLLAAVDNPHESLRVVHIAGTSGKTSTAYFCAALLKAAGARVGLTISPHITSITERLQIDGRPMDEPLFCSYFEEFISHFDMPIDATYFELLITFVLWVFARERVDYAVLETGLGGLHDGTNVCQRADKLCILTDIGFDHMAVLGDTIEQIAGQKAGIMHAGNHAFCYDQGEAVLRVFGAHASSVSAYLHIIPEPSERASADQPLYQQRNWSLAHAAVSFLCERDGLILPDESMLEQTKVQVPGRMHIVRSGSTDFILDGAHNPQKMQAFVDSLQARYGAVQFPVIMAMKHDKDFERTIGILAPSTGEVYCVDFAVNQDFPHQSIEPNILAGVWQKRGIPAAANTMLAEALRAIKDKKEPVCIVTGSLYVLGDALRELKL